MPSTTSLITRLKEDFPQFSFVDSDTFRWSPQSSTIFYDGSSFSVEDLLHEISHGLLEHKEFNRDIELIAMERDAWNYTQQHLAPIYLTKAIDESVTENALDTYRDWLHIRSICPNCTATGIQTRQSYYSCIACSSNWRVNDARSCALRRYILK